MNKFLIIAGPNVIESEDHTINMAKKLKEIFNKFDNIDFVFKTSFDKANRTSVNSYRGLGFDEGLSILKKVKDTTGLKVITDVHEIYQVAPVAEVVDVLETDTHAEPASAVGATASIKDSVNYIKAMHRNKMTQTATTTLLRNDADTGTISTSTVSDDGSTFTRGKHT